MEIAESRNSKTTSESTRTLSGTTLPKIKPQMSSKVLRNQFKLSNKRNLNKERSINDDSPDYSSSFASVDVSLKDLRKNSDSESEKLIQSKQQVDVNSQRNSSRSRKYSVDSGVMNKSDSGKVTQRTDNSRISSSKSRRNSIAVCPSLSAEEVEKYLKQDSLAAKEETHKSIKEELKVLEDKLLQGTSFLEMSRTKSFDTEENEDMKGDYVTPRDGSEDESDQYNRESLDDDTWSKIHERVKAESDAAEAKLEGYYNSLERSELTLEETENYIALEQEQKERLLKALKEIDREAGGVSSASSVEDTEPNASLNHGSTRRKSDGFNYNFTKNIENLHKGRPVHSKIKIPVIEKMKQEEKEYLSNIENGKKDKADFMKELFGKLDMSLQSESFSNSERPNEREQLITLHRSFD